MVYSNNGDFIVLSNDCTNGELSDSIRAVLNAESGWQNGQKVVCVQYASDDRICVFHPAKPEFYSGSIDSWPVQQSNPSVYVIVNSGGNVDVVALTKRFRVAVEKAADGGFLGQSKIDRPNPIFMILVWFKNVIVGLSRRIAICFDW